MYKILIVSTDPQDAELLRTTIGPGKPAYRVQWCQTWDDWWRGLKKWRPDLIVADLHCQDFTALDMLQQLHQQKSAIPLICMSEALDIAMLVESIKEGAVDFVLKTDSDRLKKVILRELHSPTRPPYTKVKNHEKQIETLNQQLTSLLQTIPDSVYFKDLEGRYQLFNRAFEHLVGLPAEEIIGKTDFDLLPAELAADCQRSDEEVIQSRELRSFEESFINHSRDHHYFESKKTPLFDEAGNLIGIVGVSREITTQKKISEQLRRTHQIYQKAIENARGVPYILNYNKDSYDFMGSNCEQLFGVSAGELTPPRLREMVIATQPKAPFAMADEHEYAELIRQGKIDYYSADVKIKTATGNIRWFSDNAVPLSEEKSGRVWGCLGILQDITERKQMEITHRVLHQIANAANRTTSLYELIESIQNSLSAIIDTTNFWLALYEAETDTLSLPYIVDQKEHFESYPADKTLTAWLIKQRKPLLLSVPAIQQLQAAGEIELTGELPQCWLGVPLQIGDQLIGVMVLQNFTDPAAYTPEDLRQLSSISEQIGLCLAHTRDTLQVQVSAERFSSIFRHSPIGIALYDTKGDLIETNRMFLTTLGITDYKPAHQLKLFESFALQDADKQRLVDRQMVNYEWQIDFGELERRSGIKTQRHGQATISVTITPVHTEQSVYNYLLQIVDITERKLLEEERVKSEKLDSLGVLIRGIAHDFNNILTAVLGNISLSKLFAVSDKRISERLLEAEKATLRARDLVQRLMAFTQSGQLNKEVTDLASLLREAVSFALSGSKTLCRMVLARDLWRCEVDQAQLLQVFNHLIINADQAMPDGGTLTITARNYRAEPGNTVNLAPGNYVQIDFQDEGIGILPKFLPKIFDPYFSTKRLGSGLGLTTAQAIIRNHQGQIKVQSTPNVGTVFTVYLPAHLEPAQASPAPIDSGFKGEGKILLMDDDLAVASVSKQLLETLNYTVDIVHDGKSALAKYREHLEAGIPYRLVILDLTIPDSMGGKTVVKQLQKIDPQVVAVVASGYADDPIFTDYTTFGFRGALKKPFNLPELVALLRKIGS